MMKRKPKSTLNECRIKNELQAPATMLFNNETKITIKIWHNQTLSSYQSKYCLHHSDEYDIGFVTNSACSDGNNKNG